MRDNKHQRKQQKPCYAPFCLPHQPSAFMNPHIQAHTYQTRGHPALRDFLIGSFFYPWPSQDVWKPWTSSCKYHLEGDLLFGLSGTKGLSGIWASSAKTRTVPDSHPSIEGLSSGARRKSDFTPVTYTISLFSPPHWRRPETWPLFCGDTTICPNMNTSLSRQGN